VPEAPLPALPPQLAARYTPVGVLGSGAMGVVLEAQEIALKRTVALKLIREPLIDDVARAYFAREVRVLTALAHPGVVRLLDGDVAGDVPWLAMALLDGRTLAEHLTHRRPALDEICGWVDGVLDALTYVHAKSIVHRDVKPSNVFVREDGTPVLIDFGLVSSSEFPRLTQTGMVLGTPRYLAPEVVTGSRPTASTDQFAVGVLGLEAATGLRVHLKPGEPASVDAVLSAAANGTYFPIAKDLARGLGPVGEVWLRAVDPDPARRFADAATMRRALADARAGKPRKRRRSRRHDEAPAAAPGLALRVVLPVAALGLALATLTAVVGSRGGEVKPSASVTPRPSPAALELLRAGLVEDERAFAAAGRAGDDGGREKAIDRAIQRLAEVRELASPLFVTPALEMALLGRLDAAIQPARAAAHAQMKLFDEWKSRQTSIEYVAMTTRQLKREYLATRRAKGHGPALEAAARKLRDALEHVAPLARAGHAIAPSPNGGAHLASLLIEVRQDAAHFEASSEVELQRAVRGWSEGRPVSWVRHLYDSHEAHFVRDASARFAALERALDAFERAHGAAPVTRDAAYLVGSLLEHELDALRYRTIEPAQAERMRERWWRWRSRAPEDPRLEVFDKELKELPVR
jgi:tRNA A-37 threonylcarbamoyl transferase component Bud32